MPSPINSSHISHTVAGTPTAGTNHSAHANVTGSTPATPIMQAQWAASEPLDAEEDINQIGHTLMQAKQLIVEDRDFFLDQSNRFTHDFNRVQGKFAELDRQILGVIENANASIEHKDDKLRRVRELGESLQYGNVSLPDARAAAKKLMPKQSQPGKYGQEHIIVLKAGGIPEQALEMSMEARSLLAKRKWVQPTKNSLDISDRLRHNANIGNHLASIPRNDRALPDNVKPTKITLASHGTPSGDNLLIKSPIHGRIAVSPEKVALRLREQLPQGNYHNKLTIAVRACNAGKNHEYGDSIVDRIASALKVNGYSGIKVTGPNEKIFTLHAGTSEYALGSYTVERGETFVKASDTNAKKTTYTDDDQYP